MPLKNTTLFNSTVVVAEIGNNHEGSLDLACELISLASDAGAYAVKFQTFKTEKLITGRDFKRTEQLKKFQLSYSDFEFLAKYCQEKNIMFLSTPFDSESVDFLKPLVSAFKISSGDNTNIPLIEKVAYTGLPILLSTGMLTKNELITVVEHIKKCWDHEGIKANLALLHCVSAYPTPPEQANILAIRELRKYSDTVGYSDHTKGIDAAIAAVTLGATIIEKHFTVRQDYSEFRDHQLSADPTELKELVQKIGNLQSLLGTEEIRCEDCESQNVDLLRRSIVTARNLAKGSVLTENDLCAVRPAGGLRPGDEKLLLGKQVKESMEKGEILYMTSVV